MAVLPDLEVRTIRGYMQGRLDKVRRGEYQASLLALPGMNRLELEEDMSVVMEPQLEAAGQVVLPGLVARPDGSFVIRRVVECARVDSARAGLAPGDELREDNLGDLFA